MKRVSDGRKNIVPIPPVVEPVEVEVTLAIVLVRDEDVPVALRILHVRTAYHPCHYPLNALGAVSYLGHYKSSNMRYQVALFLKKSVSDAGRRRARFHSAEY